MLEAPLASKAFGIAISKDCPDLLLALGAELAVFRRTDAFQALSDAWFGPTAVVFWT